MYVYSSPDYTLDVNTLYVTTSDGVVVLDSQLLPRHAEAVLRDIRARTDAPIRYVTNSHHHPDHVFGNLVFAEAGAELVSSYFTARMIDQSSFWYLMFLPGHVRRAPAADLRGAPQHVRALAGAVAGQDRGAAVRVHRQHDRVGRVGRRDDGVAARSRRCSTWPTPSGRARTRSSPTARACPTGSSSSATSVSWSTS